MKLNGKKIEGPNEVVMVFPRERDGTNQDIILKAGAVLDYDEFEKMCPAPSPPEIVYANGDIKLDVKDKKFAKAMDNYAERKTAWMILKSLESTNNLEWDTVDPNDPETFMNYTEELKEAGFSEIERLRIIQKVMEASGLNQEKIEEAMNRFLVDQGQVQKDVSSPSTEPSSTPSGEVVSVSESDQAE